MKVNENFSIWFGEIFKNIEVIKLWNLQDKRMKEFESLKKEMIVYEKKWSIQIILPIFLVKH